MSSPAPAAREFYTVGGTVNPQLPSYVERSADQELLSALRAGEYCYVLASRQMGKSSLMARAAARLKEDAETQTAIIDVTQIGGGEESAERWYYGVTHRLSKELGLPGKLGDWWRQKGDMPPVQKLFEYLREVALPSRYARIIVFIDEIDSTMKLSFADDFFAAIRACYNARATEPAFARLCFVLLGVASPHELIRDTTRTPFNIGRRINLTDFSLEESRPLTVALASDEAQRLDLMQRILYWTGGHPYLTQSLCRAVAREDAMTKDEALVDRVVHALFLTPEAREQDSNLKFVGQRISSRKKDVQQRILSLYLRALKGGKVPDQPLSEVHTELKLAGLAKTDDRGRLMIRNRIYRQVFDVAWVRVRLPIDWVRRGLIAALALLFVVSGYALYYLLVVLPEKERIDALKRDLGSAESVALAQTNYWLLEGRIPPAERELLVKDFFERLARRYEVEALVRKKAGKFEEALLYAALAGHTRSGAMPADFVREAQALGYDKLEATLREGHHGSINSAVFALGGKRVLSASEDGSLAWWDPAESKLVWSSTTSQARFASIADIENGTRVAITHHPLRFKDGPKDGHVSLLEPKLDGLRPIAARDRRVPLRVVGSVVSSDGEQVLLAGDDLAVWDLGTDRIEISRDVDYKLWAAAYSPDGDRIAAGCSDGIIRIFRRRLGTALGVLVERDKSITGVAWGRNGLLAAMAYEGGVSVWDVGLQKRVSSPSVQGKPVAVEFCGGSGALLIGERESDGGRLQLVGAIDGNVAFTLRWEGTPLTTASLDRACDRVVTGWRDGVVRIFSTRGDSPKAEPWELWQRKLGLTIAEGSVHRLGSRPPTKHADQSTFP